MKTGYLLVALGLIQALGYFLGLNPLTQIGFYSAASPMAIAFSHDHGIDSFALKINYRAISADGRMIAAELTTETYRNYQAHPYLRNIYANICRANNYRDRNQEAVVQRLLQWGYCTPGDVASALNLPSPISSITFEMKSHREPNQSWNLVVNCPK